MIFDTVAWEKYVKGYTFHNFCILDKNTFFFILKEKIIFNRGKTRFLFTKTDEEGKRFYVCNMDENFAEATVTLATSVPEFVCVDAQRRVFSLGPRQAQFEEPIKNRLAGGRGNQTITRAVRIGGSVYGIGRPMRIYRRDGMDQWVHHNARAALNASDRQRDGAFHDMDGFSSKDMYAVGDAGAVWHYDGESWRVQEFPATLDLRTVVCADDSNVYLTDSDGSVWQQRDGQWQLRVKGEGIGFSDSVWFAGQLWCAANAELCVMEGNRMVPAHKLVHRPLPALLQTFCSHLTISPDGRHLLLGCDDGLVRYDGQTWETLYDSRAYNQVTRRRFVCSGVEQKFWQIETDGFEMTVCFGKVGRKGRTQHKRFANTELCDREAERLIAERREHGYIERLLLTRAEAGERYSLEQYFPEVNWSAQDGQVCVFDGDLALNQLTMEAGDASADLLLIAGNLTIDGDIDLCRQGASHVPQRLLVLGNVSAGNLCCDDQQVVILGDLQLNGCLYCPVPVGANGSLTVRGQTRAAYLVRMKDDAPRLDLHLSPDTESLDSETLAHYEDKMPFYQHGVLNLDGLLAYLRGNHPDSPFPLAGTHVPLQLLDGMTAQQRYPELASLKNLHLAHRWVLVCDGDMSLNNHLMLDWESADAGGWLRALNIISSSGGVAGLLINGNLSVNGVVASHHVNGPFLCVRGNLQAQSIVSGGPLLLVNGSIHAEHAVIGFDHGLLSCGGSLHADYLMICGHRLFVGGDIDAVTIDESGDALPNADYVGKAEMQRIFSSQVFSGQRLSRTRIVDRLRNGKPLIRKGVRPARLAVAKLLSAYRAAGGQQTELDLRDRGLQEFPKTILEMRGLKSLKLSRNALRTIPESICRLTELETLELDECQLGALPASIGRLEKLKHLSLAGNNLASLPVTMADLQQLTSLNLAYNSTPLPENIGALQQLRELDLHGNKRLLPLPDSLAQLTRLESLSLANCLGGTNELVGLPSVVTRLSGLKSLDLSGNSLNSLPDDITRLESLRSLNLNSSLRGVKQLPDLSAMHHLQTLHFGGQRQFSSSLPPPHELLLALLQSPPPRLQALMIDGWGKEDGIYQAGSYLKGLFRDELTTLPDCFAEFPALRSLHMRFNGLETLPPSLFALPHLEELNVYGNKLSDEWINQLAAAYPGIRLETFNNWSEHDSEAYRQARQAIRTVNRQLASTDYQNAFDGYSRLIEEYRAGEVYAEHDLYYACYGRQYALTRLLERRQCTLDFEDQMRVYFSCVEQARAKPVWAESELGKLQLVMQQEAYTGLARCLIKNAATPIDRERALKYAEQACAVSHEYCAAHESKARILLALGRDEEAYQLVTEILKADDEFPGLADLKTSKEYKQWLAGQREQPSSVLQE